MRRVEHTSNNDARLRLARVVRLLNRAGEQLQAARHASDDRYHRNALNEIVIGLRDVSLPLSRIASSLKRGCE
jgi:hypothetical protein